MLFTRSLLVSLVAAPLLAFAQNTFKVPAGGYNATAGQSLALAWTPSTSGTISLILRQGASSALEAGSIIATNLTNSGSYTWSIPSSVVRGSDYTVEIVDDSDNSVYNFTPYFVIESLVTVATTTSIVSLGAPTSSVSLSSLSHSGSMTTSMTGSASTTTTTGSSSSSASSGSSTGSASSTSQSSTSATSSAASTSHSATGAVSPTGNVGARATAAVGMLGALALGALAL